MKRGATFLYEWKHFIRSPFKLIALLLFLAAGLYGLHNGERLYTKQQSEIERIEQKVLEERQKVVGYFQEGNLVPEDRPWIDYSTPFWAIWFSWVYDFKSPSPAMVYSLGQSEQYGYYKRVTFWASPYDGDLVEEIANPERLQMGTLDYSFALLFLMPLLLLVLTYNIKSAETEQGFMPLVLVQSASKTSWILARLGFYVVLIATVLLAIIAYGALLTGVFASASSTMFSVLLLSLLYLLFWATIYGFILNIGNSIMGNTLKMVGCYLLFTFIIPGAVHQYVSIRMPANLMTDFIEVRDQQQELYDQPDSVFRAELFKLFPELSGSPVNQDSTRAKRAVSQSASSLINELKKASIKPIEAEHAARRELVHATFWFNPVSFFQNQLNAASETHFDDYQAYKVELQHAIDHQINIMVNDLWNDRKVDQSTYEAYFTELRKK